MSSNNRYSWNAEDYAKHSSAQKAWARELLNKLKLKGRESVLDVGCGDGKVSAEIADHLPNGGVVGVDSSDDMIALARTHFPEEYSSFLNKSVLEPIRVELIPKVMSYDDKEGLAGWIRTTWLPYTQRVPDDKRSAFINQIVDQYVESNPPDHDGKIRVNMVRLEVEAVKTK